MFIWEKGYSIRFVRSFHLGEGILNEVCTECSSGRRATQCGLYGMFIWEKGYSMRFVRSVHLGEGLLNEVCTECSSGRRDTQ